MPVPSNPALTDVYAEFSAPAGTGLSAFLRGGAYVPNVPANAGVPTALPITMQQLVNATHEVPPPPLVVNVTPANLSRTVEVYGLYTNAATANPSGGIGTYTYRWTRVSGYTGFQIETPNAKSTRFRFGGSVPPNTTQSATFRCTVTSGEQTASDTVNVTITYDPPGDGGGPD